MVRDIRARVYDDGDPKTIPVKVDVETLYILEQKSDKNTPLSSNVNLHLSDQNQHRSPNRERQDFVMQTVSPSSTNAKPISIQIDSIVPQQTNSLHRSTKERSRLPSSTSSITDEEQNPIHRTKITTTKYEIKRRFSSHYSSDEEEEGEDGAAVIFIDNKSDKSDYEDNFELKRERHNSSIDDPPPVPLDQQPTFGRITSRIRIDQLRDINRHVVRRHVQEHCNDNDNVNDDEHRSKEVYEIHTRGACKCLVISSEESTQYGNETRFEKQLQRIERTYAEEELKAVELHVIVSSTDRNYQLVKRDYGSKKFPRQDTKENHQQPTISIYYYDKDGQRVRSEPARRLEQLPLFIRCEIEYELNHYGQSICSSKYRQKY